MNYILLNSDGSVKKTNFTETIQQNNDGVNQIFVNVDGLDIATHSLVGVFVLPDGTVSEEAGVATNNVEYSNNETADGYVLTLTQGETRLAGLVYLTLQVKTTATQNILYTFRVALTINETASVASLTLITLAQYNSIKEYIDTNFLTAGDAAQVLENYVPYEGATQNMKLGTHNLSAAKLVAGILLATSSASAEYQYAVSFNFSGDITKYNNYVATTYSLPSAAGTLATQEWAQANVATQKRVIGSFNTSQFVYNTPGGYSSVGPINLNLNGGYISDSDFIVITWGNSYAICPIPEPQDTKGDQLVDGSFDDDIIEDGRYIIGTYSLLGEWEEEELYSYASAYISLYGTDTYHATLTNGEIEVIETYEDNDQTYTKVQLTFDLGANAAVLCPGWDSTFDIEDVNVWELVRVREGHVAAAMISNDGYTKNTRIKYILSEDGSQLLNLTLADNFQAPSNYTAYIKCFKL